MNSNGKYAEIDCILARTTRGPWRKWSQPPGIRCDWVDSLPKNSIAIESTGTVFALGVAVAATGHENDARFICAAREAVPQMLEDLNVLAGALLHAYETLPNDPGFHDPRTVRALDLARSLRSAQAKK